MNYLKLKQYIIETHEPFLTKELLAYLNGDYIEDEVKNLMIHQEIAGEHIGIDLAGQCVIDGQAEFLKEEIKNDTE